VTTFDAEKKQLATLCLNRKTGQVRWKQVAPAKEVEPFHRTGSPATCSPACDGRRVYAFFGSYGLLCYDVDGKLIWSKPMGPFQDEFGASSSPVLLDDLVIVNSDHDIDNFIIAVDKESGKTVWKTPREGFTRSYSTPIIWEQNGKKQIVVAGSLRLVAYDPRDGKEAWWVNGLARIVSPTPVKANGRLYVASWTPGGDPAERISMEQWADAAKTYDKNSDSKIAQAELPKGGAVDQRFFRIDLDQDGKLDQSEWEKHAKVFESAQNGILAIRPGGMGNVTDSGVEWSYRKSLPSVPSPLFYRGVVYIVKDSGIVTSLDASSGKLLKQGRAEGRGNYYASPVAGDGKVYMASERGVITVFKAGRELEKLSSHDFGERIMATPVISGGSIYVRTDNAIYCFGQ
jgi:outer membrane protein assembly factor BamB